MERKENRARRFHELKRGRQPPPFLTGEVSLPLLAGLLLPALGFLRHCLLSPPSCGFGLRECPTVTGGCRLARSPPRHSALRFPPARRLERRGERAELVVKLPTGGLSSSPSYNM